MMSTLKEIYQCISKSPYLMFLTIIIGTFILAIISKWIMKRILKPLAGKTQTKVDDIIIKHLANIIFYIVLLLGIKAGLTRFEIKTLFYASLIDTLMIIIIVILAIKIINEFAQHWMKDWKFKTKTSADERLIPFLQKIVKAVVVILGLIFIFSAWKINISPLLATAGIAGLAIGLAVKDSLNNILGGLQLVLDKTFKVTDKVQLESGEMGVILDIGLRSTKLKTYDNEVIYIPNGYLANAKIKNFTQPDLSVRVNVNFGTEYGSDPELVRKVVLETIKEVDTVLSEPEPLVLFLKMSDFSLDFVARAWVKKYSEAYDTHIAMTDRIYEALNKAGIGIPFPTHTVYTKKID